MIRTLGITVLLFSSALRADIIFSAPGQGTNSLGTTNQAVVNDPSWYQIPAEYVSPENTGDGGVQIGNSTSAPWATLDQSFTSGAGMFTAEALCDDVCVLQLDGNTIYPFLLYPDFFFPVTVEIPIGAGEHTYSQEIFQTAGGPTAGAYELTFPHESITPEPSEWVLCIIGLLFVAGVLVVRRRKA